MKFLGFVPGIFYLNRFTDLLSILLQIAGISYITFKVIQLYIDEKENEKTVSILNFFNFTTFVPTLLIGPIDRYARFTSNVESGYVQMNYSNFTKGFDNFIKGLVTWIFIITSTFILIKYFIQATLLNSIPITNPEVPIEMDSQKTLLQPIQESNLYPNNNKFTLEKFYM